MSRSAHPRRNQPREFPAAHKRLRAAVHRELNHERARMESSRRGAWMEVRADELEENGQLDRAEALRNFPELVLPRATQGWSTRLRW